MALHEVDIKFIDKRTYTCKMLDEFVASDMAAAQVDVPEGWEPNKLRINLYNRIKGRELSNKFAVRMTGGKVYLLRK